MEDPKNKSKPIDRLVQMWDAGIPVERARFHSDVNNADQTPEGEFNDGSDKSSRRVEMRLTPQGLMCYQRSHMTKKDVYFMVSHATVKQMTFKLREIE
jgi:hypothetical protein